MTPEGSEAALPENGEIVLEGVAPLGLLPRLGRVCVACEWSAKEGRDRVCRFNPPQVGFIGVPVIRPSFPGRPPEQGIQIQTMTQSPIVRDDQWCGQFSAGNIGQGLPAR